MFNIFGGKKDDTLVDIKNDASAELGVITEINKRRLADIGYYILNIVSIMKKLF